MMNIQDGADRVARWLNRIRDEGRPCPTNLVQSARLVLDCSPAIARTIKAYLTESGRLVINPIRSIYVIDGKHFDTKVQDQDEAAVIKTVLRRRYRPVYDPRTVAYPERVAKGRPKALVLGDELVPFDQCLALARSLGVA